VLVIISSIVLSVSCQKKVPVTSWLDSLHEKGKSIFYKTIMEEISAHKLKSQLTDNELTKILEAETRYDRLYELLINIFYQKDEPAFYKLIEKSDKESKFRFQAMYQELARFSAHMFVESFFATDWTQALM